MLSHAPLQLLLPVWLVLKLLIASVQLTSVIVSVTHSPSLRLALSVQECYLPPPHSLFC